jgi:hypothetical protein
MLWPTTELGTEKIMIFREYFAFMGISHYWIICITYRNKQICEIVPGNMYLLAYAKLTRLIKGNKLKCKLLRKQNMEDRRYFNWKR